VFVTIHTAGTAPAYLATGTAPLLVTRTILPPSMAPATAPHPTPGIQRTRAVPSTALMLVGAPDLLLLAPHASAKQV